MAPAFVESTAVAPAPVMFFDAAPVAVTRMVTKEIEVPVQKTVMEKRTIQEPVTVLECPPAPVWYEPTRVEYVSAPVTVTRKVTRSRRRLFGGLFQRVKSRRFRLFGRSNTSQNWTYAGSDLRAHLYEHVDKLRPGQLATAHSYFHNNF